MILLDIKRFLQSRHTANLQEIAWHFKQSPDFIRTLMAHWVRKGKVKVAEKPAGCGSRCTQCKPDIAEVYVWQLD